MSAILIVDDDPGIRAVIRSVLEHQAYAIHEAADGEEALAFVQEREVPDLVILDLMMPGTGGLDVLKRLKGDPATARCPVVVLTAAGAPAREEAEAAGADGFFEKPFSPLALLRAVEEAMGARPGV